MSDVEFHPRVLEQIRDWSGASFLRMDPKDAKFYVEHDLLALAGGELLDFETRKPTGESLYRLTREAMVLAYPDGVLMPRYKCTVCGKVTAGRYGTNYPTNTWYPRKHRVDGEVCDGSSIEAETVRVLHEF